MINQPTTLEEARKQTYGMMGRAKYREGFCVADVPEGGRSPLFHQCQKKNGFGPAGLFCKVHDPAQIAARQKKAEDKWRAKLKANGNQSRLANAAPDLLAALQGLMECKIITGQSAGIQNWARSQGIPDPLEAAKAAITKATL